MPSIRQWSKEVGAHAEATAASINFTAPVVRLFLGLSFTKNQLCPSMAVAEIITPIGQSPTVQDAAAPKTLTRTSCSFFGSYMKPWMMRLPSAATPVGVKISLERFAHNVRGWRAGIPAATAAVNSAPVEVPAQ